MRMKRILRRYLPLQNSGQSKGASVEVFPGIVWGLFDFRGQSSTRTAHHIAIPPRLVKSKLECTTCVVQLEIREHRQWMWIDSLSSCFTVIEIEVITHHSEEKETMKKLCPYQ
mmetsp:Transcript_1292/g.1743  ORF Transcript_1292/g.1743 Transcript_1292/m.1743 type:complete len:113 (+) Transcript_1292:1175-1513(+)